MIWCLPVRVRAAGSSNRSQPVRLARVHDSIKRNPIELIPRFVKKDGHGDAPTLTLAPCDSEFLVELAGSINSALSARIPMNPPVIVTG
jgi:hypothetical protein